jgi:hypothetical protein
LTDHALSTPFCKHLIFYACIFSFSRYIASINTGDAYMDGGIIGKAKGGKARAKSLSPEDRKAIAKQAADTRWNDQIPTALKTGILTIGEIDIACAVLPDGTRVLSERAITKAFGVTRGGSHWRRKKAGEVGADLPPFLSASNISSNLSSVLTLALTTPKIYRDDKSRAVGHGIEATLLPKICNELLTLRDKGNILHPSQAPIVLQADILIRGLADIGIIALVDEATGYQEVRDKQALQAMLDAFLRKELAAWAKRFPDEFYEQIFRLRGWPWKGRGTNPPQVVASYTKDIVYARLAPAVLKELEKKNPIENGRRKSKHHQWLTEDVGHPALAQHLHAVIMFMRVSNTWDQFKLMLDKAAPKRGDTLQLPLMEDTLFVDSTSSSSETLPLFEQSPAASAETETLPEPSLL